MSLPFGSTLMMNGPFGFGASASPFFLRVFAFGAGGMSGAMNLPKRPVRSTIGWPLSGLLMFTRSGSIGRPSRSTGAAYSHAG